MFHCYSEVSHHNILPNYQILLFMLSNTVSDYTHPPPHYKPIAVVVHTYYQLIVLSAMSHQRVLQHRNNPQPALGAMQPLQSRVQKGLCLLPAQPRSSAAPSAEFLHTTSNTETEVCRRLMFYCCSSGLVAYSLLTGK